MALKKNRIFLFIIFLNNINILAATGNTDSYTNMSAGLQGFSLSNDVVLKSATILDKDYTYVIDSTTTNSNQVVSQKSSLIDGQNAVIF